LEVAHQEQLPLRRKAGSVVDTPTEQAAILRAIVRLGELGNARGDLEIEHSTRDEILVDLLDVLAPEVASIARDREEQVGGYWYA
jgi:hypothetical protein